MSYPQQWKAIVLVHVLCFFLLIHGKAQRTTQLFNDGWKYLEDSSRDFPEIAVDEWKEINLPHTWNQWDATDNSPGYRRDAGWYYKEFSYLKDPAKSVRLYLEGANMESEVFLNGERVGGHIGGYVGFEVQLTEQVIDGINKLAIRVSNAYNPNLIPSQKADFFLYGGITRDVWLIEYPQVYLEDIVWTTPVLNEEEATIQFSGGLSVSRSLVEPEIVVELLSPDEEVVAKNRFELLREELVEKDGSFILPSFPLNNPALWSPEAPNLYTARISLIAGGKELDIQEERLGLRWFSFNTSGAFMLNGQKLLLRGTHRHEEHAGYGAAMPDSLHRRDMELIKEMGANFVRLGHYPQDPEVYRACDELGLIVWDELPWCRGGIGGEEWRANTRRLLQEQILQNRHHPSICFWSLGNEIYWLPDFPGGGSPEKLNRFLKELNELAHKLDPSRLTALRKYYDGADLVDVFSPSIWAGWYAGVYTNYESALARERKKYPNMLHMEYGGSSHVGRHTETPVTGDGLLSEEEWAEVANQVSVKNIAKEGDWTENYIVDLFDWHLSVSEAFPDFAGNAQWAFKDFGTPLRPENAIPYVNQKGLLDRAGNPKDGYYVFKSYWSEEPFVYIESHTWTERAGPEGKIREVSVYSNCPEVELFHNGASLGKRALEKGNFPAHNLRWQVGFSEGTNDLLAVGYVGEEVSFTDSLRLSYRYQPAGKPHHISLQARPVEKGKFLVEATMVDQEGNRVLTYEDRVYFSLNGQGQLVVNYGTPTGSQVIEMANGRASIEVFLPEGKAVIEARNQDFKGSYLTIAAEN